MNYPSFNEQELELSQLDEESNWDEVKSAIEDDALEHYRKATRKARKIKLAKMLLDADDIEVSNGNVTFIFNH